MPGEEELQPIGEGPETKPLLPGFKAGFNLSSTWSSFSSLTTSITHSIGQGIGTDNQKLLAITLNSWVSRKPDVDPVLSLQFPLFQSDVEKVICAAGHDYALIAEVLKPHAKSDAWSLQGTPDYEPPGLSGDQSACWLIGLYNAIEALPDKKADHTHLKTHVFKPYCEAHLRARVEQLLVYPLPSVELEFAVIELGGLAKILDDGDLKCRVQYIVQAFEHAIGYFNGQHVGIAPVVYEEAHKEDPAFSLNKKLEHIQKKYNTEVINLLNQMIRTSAIDKKMQRVDELCNPGFAVDKKTQSLVSANADYKLACSIDDELDGLFNKNAVFENINNIITQTTGLRVESCKLNMFARIEKFRDASCEQFLADLCAANTLDELQNFYKQYVESSQPLQHMDLDQLTCDNHKLVWYRFWNDIKSVLFFFKQAGTVRSEL